MFIFGLGTLPVMSGGGMVAKKILKYTPRVFHDLFHPASCLIVAVWSIFVLV